MADKKISQLTAATTPLAGTEVAPIVQSNSTVKVALSTIKDWILSLSNTFTADQTVVGKMSATRLEASGNYAANGGDVTLTNTNGGHSWRIGDGIAGAVGSLVVFDATASAIRTYFDSAGNQNLSNGNLVIGTSGKGIDFSATASGSGTMTSELLADYEEGTWTPSISGSTTDPTYTSSYANGIYTKIGRIVYFEFSMDVTGVTTQGTGSIALAGLPYAPGPSWSVTSYGANTNIVYNDVWDQNVRNGYAHSSSKIFFAQNAVTQANYTYATCVLSTGSFAGSGWYTV